MVDDSEIQMGELVSVAGQPTVKAVALAGGYLRLTVASAETSYEGEIRYDVTIAGIKPE